MGELYHHSQATQITNQLGQHALDMNEANLNNWTDKTLLYQQKSGQDKTNAAADVRSEAEKSIVEAPIVAKTTATTLKAGRAFGVGAYRGISQAEGVADSVKGVGRGFTGAYQTLKAAGKGTKLFGEGSVAVKDMTGVEGIVGKNFLSAGGGEAFAKVAGKSAGLLGAAITVGGDMDNLFETGNLFNSKNADGSVKKATLGEDVGNVASLVAGGLDVLAAFTGGALAPVAAAANIASTGLSVYEEHKADEATKKQDDNNVPPSKPPTTVAPPVFAQLGLQSNMNHDPLSHIG